MGGIVADCAGLVHGLCEKNPAAPVPALRLSDLVQTCFDELPGLRTRFCRLRRYANVPVICLRYNPALPEQGGGGKWLETASGLVAPINDYKARSGLNAAVT